MPTTAASPARSPEPRPAPEVHLSASDLEAIAGMVAQRPKSTQDHLLAWLPVLVLAIGLITSWATQKANVAELERRTTRLEEVVVPRAEHDAERKQKDQLEAQRDARLDRLERKLDAALERR